MEQDSKNSQASEPTQVAGTQAEVDNPNQFGETNNTGHPSWMRREATKLTLQDLLDLPRQILPEETYIHLRNAGREAALAVFTLWRSIEKTRKGGDKVRTHIDVE